MTVKVVLKNQLVLKTDVLSPCFNKEFLKLQNFCVVETHLLDFHRMIIAIMKASFTRADTEIVSYRD